MEINMTITIPRDDGETKYTICAPTIEMAIEKLGSLERTLKEDDEYVGFKDSGLKMKDVVLPCTEADNTQEN